MFWLFVAIVALCVISGVVTLGNPSLNGRERARYRLVGWCFQVAMIAMIGAAVSKPSPMLDTYNEDYLRQTEKVDKLQAAAERQTVQQDENDRRYRQILGQEEQNQMRFEKLLNRWNVILEAQEKQAGIKRMDSDP